MIKTLVAILVLLTVASRAPAQERPENESSNGGSKQTLGQQSLDPTASLKQIQIQNRFIPNTFDVDGYSNLLNVAGVFPIDKFEKFPFRQLSRLEFPIFTAPGGPTGLSDVRFFNLVILDEGNVGKGKWWWRYGLGPIFVFPTASKGVLGSGKWQVGPTFGAILSSKKWQFAILIQNPISFAGDNDRPDVNRLIWQPILAYWLPKGWYLGFQGTTKTINWENDAALTLPLSLRLGKVTKIRRRYVNLFVEPEYTVVHDDGPAPEWSIRVGFNFLFPL